MRGGREAPPALAAMAGLLAVAASITVTSPATASASVTTWSRCFGHRATVGGTSGDDVLRGTEGNDFIAGLGGDDVIVGGGGHDHLCGGSGDDVLHGGTGMDFVIPGGGRDRAFGGPDRINVIAYFKSPAAVTVDLRAGWAAGWGRDEVHGFHQVAGSPFDDVIAGNAGGNALLGYGGDDVLIGRKGHDSLGGSSGDDTLRGGRGFDYAEFMDSPRPVRVDLRRGLSHGEGDDVLRGIENLFGSPGSDVLVGNFRANELIGGILSGDDDMRGKGGRDVFWRARGAARIEGGGGRDTVYYAFAGAVDLTRGLAVGLDYSDSIAGIENVFGGDDGHEIVGDGNDNVLDGGAGRDVIRGADGDDDLRGSGGADVLLGGDGVDEIAGGGGDDACAEGEHVRECERAIAAMGRSAASIPVTRAGRECFDALRLTTIVRFGVAAGCGGSDGFAAGARLREEVQ